MTNPQPDTVIIVDERPLIVDALKALIALDARFSVIAAGGSDLDPRVIARLRPSLALVGVGHMQDRPLRTLEALHRLAPVIRTVLIADTQDPELVQCVLDNRVSALLLTASSGADLVMTLEQVLRGQTALPSGWQAVLSKSEGDPVSGLSQRQLEVLRLLADGYTYEEIAASLVITANTVKFHVRTIYLRLGVRNRIAARKLLEVHEPRHIRAGGL